MWDMGTIGPITDLVPLGLGPLLTRSRADQRPAHQDLRGNQLGQGRLDPHDKEDLTHKLYS